MCWNKGRLCWKIAKLFHFCHLKKLVRPETFGPYYVCFVSLAFIQNQILTWEMLWNGKYIKSKQCTAGTLAAVKAWRDVDLRLPACLNHVTRWSSVVNYTFRPHNPQRNRPLVFIEFETMWAPEGPKPGLDISDKRTEFQKEVPFRSVFAIKRRNCDKWSGQWPCISVQLFSPYGWPSSTLQSSSGTDFENSN